MLVTRQPARLDIQQASERIMICRQKEHAMIHAAQTVQTQRPA
jgi:hypothetical protein